MGNEGGGRGRKIGGKREGGEKRKIRARRPKRVEGDKGRVSEVRDGREMAFPSPPPPPVHPLVYTTKVKFVATYENNLVHNK